jgi:hypothetical protein
MAACAAPRPPLAFEPATPWAEPIADYLAVGAEKFPEEFTRAITALQVFDGRLWIGYGDGTRNLGTVVPIEFRSFASPDDPACSATPVLADGQGAPQRTPTDSGEEQLEPYRILDGVLCQAGVDSNDPDEAWTQAKGPERVIEGNFFRLVSLYLGLRWHKFRSIPGGEHVHDLAALDGALYAVGSGAADRAEFEGGQVYRYLWKSTDGGARFEVVHRVMYPEIEKGDTRFRKLLAVGHTLYVFGYVNPYVDGGPLEGRHLVLARGELRELTGELAPLVVQRTYDLPDGTGLVVTRAADGATRAFRAREDGFTELTSWRDRRVLDVTPAPEHDELLLLSGDRGTPERFAVHAAPLAELAALRPLLDLGLEPPSALALWHGQLFVGTAAGQVWKARARP